MPVDAETAASAAPLRGAGGTSAPDAGRPSASAATGPDRPSGAATGSCASGQPAPARRPAQRGDRGPDARGGGGACCSACRSPSSRWRSSSLRSLVLNIVASARLKRGTPGHASAPSPPSSRSTSRRSPALLLCAGGSANPFAVLYLLHVVADRDAAAVAKRASPARRSSSRASRSRFALPSRCGYADGQPLSDATLALGLWVSFALTAAVTAWFVVRIVADAARARPPAAGSRARRR